MLVHEVVREMAARGIYTNQGRVRYAVTSGKIAPPPRDKYNRRIFSQLHLMQLEVWLRAPHQGRPISTPTLAIT